MRLKRWMPLVLAALLLAGLWMGTASAEETDKNKLAYFSHSRLTIPTGSSFDKFVRALEVLKDTELCYFNSKTDCVNAVLSGKADAMPQDLPVALYLANTNPGLYVVEEPLAQDTYAFALQKDSPFKADIDAALQEMKANGTYDELYNIWFGADESVKHCLVQDWEGENGTIRFMSDFESIPMAYIGDGGEHRGFEVDLLLHAAQIKGYRVEFSTGNMSTTIAALAAGKVDAAAMAISITEERKRSMDFSEPTMEGAVVLLARDPNYVADSQTAGFFQNVAASFQRTFVAENRWRLFGQGILITLAVTLMGVAGGTVLGLVIYFLCRKCGRVGKKIGGVLSRFFNGIPVVVLLMILFYVVFAKSKLAGIWVASIGFVLLFAISFYDMISLAISTLGKDQAEAAYALGYSDNGAFFQILLPQALPRFLPSYITAITNILKGTAVVGYIAVEDLTKISDIIRSRTFDAILPLAFVAVIYFLIEGLANVSLGSLERMINQRTISLSNILWGVKQHDKN